MIRDFWVENYLSIRDRQSISFVSKSASDFLNVEVAPGVFLNKLGIMYGANASGKSNMLYAIQNIFSVLFKSHTDIGDKVTSARPFELTKDKPTKMHITFYAESIRYDYDVEYVADYIIKELLYYYPNGSKALFYERTFKGTDIQAEIKFGQSLEMKAETQKTLKDNTLNNHSVLSAYRKASFKEDIRPISLLFRWVEEHIHEVNGDSVKNPIEELKDVFNDEKRKKFYQLMLKKADLNISGFRPVTVPRNVSGKMRRMILDDASIPESMKKKFLSDVEEDIVFTNKSKDGDFEIPRRLQSMGTMQYIKSLHFLYDLITGNHVYLLDELDEDMHYDLVLYFLNVFLFNSDKSQLIFTSQETALLAEDLLNEHRDLVWFVEKDHKTASSVYSRADSYGLHKNLSLYNSYKIGRLGAKPELGSPFINFD
ncbi:MAG: ATP-binding protein [Salinivirgaceae bacterium]|nr:ATP-binding protein [Salinivirgaceae bacterium]MBR6082000.1 ATP-binding protein [Salinivirgaceae bacterium]